MRGVLPVVVAVLALGPFAVPLKAQTQAAPADAAQTTQAVEDAAARNASQARAALDAMVRALGGQAWLSMKNQMRQGHVAAFFQGKPSGGTTEYWEYHAWPDQDRLEYTKHSRRVAVLCRARRVGSYLSRQNSSASGSGGRLSSPPRSLHRDGRQGVAQRS